MTLTAHELKTEYLELLDGKHNEQTYQKYIETNTRLIPRDFVQNHGIGCSLVLRKLSFGSDYKSDFFFFSKSSDDWNAVHIEIEKPQSKFFKEGTNEFHLDFSKAIQQINKWKAWFNRGNQEGFLKSLASIQVPSYMARVNPTYDKFVLVFGRRAEYEGNAVRRSLIQSMETADFKIITFDSLAEDLENKYDVSIGVRKNEYIDIITDEITNSGLYSWVEPTSLRVSETLYDRLKNGPKSNHMIGGVESHEHAAKTILVRKDKEPVEDDV